MFRVVKGFTVVRYWAQNPATVEPRFNDLRYYDIPGIMINIGFPKKVRVRGMAQNPGITIFGLTIFQV